MLTGHDEITDRVKALDAGVDDYLIKPFSIDNGHAPPRCKTAQTSTGSQGRRPQHEHANPGCDAGRAIRLSVKEYDLLNFLMRRPRA